jgi:hypothetical protein
MEEWGGQWELVWSDDEYADEYWDPKRTKLETLAAYRRAIERHMTMRWKCPPTLWPRTRI